MHYKLFIVCLLFAANLPAQTPRLILPMNRDWQFIKSTAQQPPAEHNDKWKAISLPHTWNVEDVMDDTQGYYRGIGWYKKNFSIHDSLRTKEVYLCFEGANQVTEIYLNGKQAGKHIGGYTGFSIRLTDLLRFDGKNNMNELYVRVDNSHDNNIPPLSADFTFYGGIYRDVWLKAMNKVHYAMDDHGSDGIFINTPDVSAAAANINFQGKIVNRTNKKQSLKVELLLNDHSGKRVAQHDMSVSVVAGRSAGFSQELYNIRKPRLWSPEDPYLYNAITRVIEMPSGKLLDEITTPIGFRWFRFDADSGFFLNGKECKLVGVSRHQDRPGMGNAVPDDLAREDVALIKKMGGNFLRVAHYPQDPSILEACDRLGVIASVEIPVVNEISETDTFFNNCRAMQVEMIRQNYNHPSIVMWCYMNEVLLRPHFSNDKPRQQIYFASIERLARMLDSVTRAEDKTRYTMLANHGDAEKYKRVGLTAIPMIVGWNLYPGWYGSSMEELPVFLDNFHKDWPGKPMMVTEYGADADPRIRSFQPQRFDKSVEYTVKFHDYYMREMMKRPFVAGVMVWNLADFNSETRTETMPHINNKGLLEWDRQPKDPFYYYQSILKKEPFIKILGASWKRSGVADSNQLNCTQALQVASNMDSIELWVDGKSAGVKKSEHGLAAWDIAFANGVNKINVVGRSHGKESRDEEDISFHLLPWQLDDPRIAFTRLNVLLGASRYYIDKKNQCVWLPDQSYRKGGWGHIGGEPFKIAGGGRLPYGTDKNILGTEDDPIYQTQLTGIEAYRVDVPDGDYEITLHFAELLGGDVKGLVYDLGQGDRSEKGLPRIFDVNINGKLFLEKFSIATTFGMATAGSKKINISVKNGEGIRIDFTKIAGESVLNAIEIRRL